jgi:DNA-directed RNA polymerase subunit H (RpoH/RPB5)
MMTRYRGYAAQGDAAVDDDGTHRATFVRALLRGDSSSSSRALLLVATSPKALERMQGSDAALQSDVVVLVVPKAAAMTRAVNKFREKATARVQAFHVDHLQNDIAAHQWVPDVEALGSEDVDRALAAYAVRPDQLPVLFDSDVMARYLDLRPGQVVRVTHKRPGGAACENPDVSYWRVVDGGHARS